MSRELKTAMAIFLALMIVGCTVHRTRLDCERHLRPINAPAPAAPVNGARP